MSLPPQWNKTPRIYQVTCPLYLSVPAGYIRLHGIRQVTCLCLRIYPFLPVSLKKLLLRRRRPLGRSARKAPNQGSETVLPTGLHSQGWDQRSVFPQTPVRPISLLRSSLLRFGDSTLSEKSLWTWEFHPFNLRFCLSQTLWSPESFYGDWP